VSVAARRLVFLAGALPLLALLVRAGLALPPAGSDPKAYGQTMIDIATTERRTSDAVAAVNFDTRGLDTLGEETILFAAVMGVTLLLRRLRGEHEEPPRREVHGRDTPGTSDAVRALTLGLTMPLVLLGLQVVSHGQLTPGGGFQGGVILATAPLAVFVAGDLGTFQRIAPHAVVVAGESLGIAAFVGVGLWGLTRGSFLVNALPLGTFGDLWSSGTILVLNLCTGLAVAAGFVSLMVSFLHEALTLRGRGS